MDNLPGSKVRYPNFVGYPSQATLTVPPSGSCKKFLPYLSGKSLTSPLQTTLSATLSLGGDPLSIGGMDAVHTYASPKAIRK